MERNGVDHAVLIQMQGQYENAYQRECARRYPGKFESVEVPVVIEHLGSLKGPDDDQQQALRQRVFGLARFPNAHIKIHGLGEFQPRAMPATEPSPFVQPIAPLLEWTYEAFGASRM